MNRTGIEWTTFSANPLKYRDAEGGVVWGCVHASEGCRHCYSEALAKRYRRGGPFAAQVMKGLTPFLDEAELRHMATATRIGGLAVAGGRCFVGDMTDLFGEWVPDGLLNRLFSDVLERRQDVTWQLLTKRADRLQKYLAWRWGEGRIPARNIHIGFSAENQDTFNERWAQASRCPAAVLWCSYEPALGPVNFRGALGIGDYGPPPRRLDWIVVGGESGPGARPFDPAWARSARDQCRTAGVPFFWKQMGRWILGDHEGFVLDRWLMEDGFTFVPPIIGQRAHERPAGAVAFTLSGKGGDTVSWPEQDRVREFPA